MVLKKINVSEKTIAITKCDKNFKCLKFDKNGSELCKVERCLENKICFLKNSDNNSCINKVFYADVEICSCPVRAEIFQKYGL